MGAPSLRVRQAYGCAKPIGAPSLGCAKPMGAPSLADRGPRRVVQNGETQKTEGGPKNRRVVPGKNATRLLEMWHPCRADIYRVGQHKCTDFACI